MSGSSTTEDYTDEYSYEYPSFEHSKFDSNTRDSAGTMYVPDKKRSHKRIISTIFIVGVLFAAAFGIYTLRKKKGISLFRADSSKKLSEASDDEAQPFIAPELPEPEPTKPVPSKPYPTQEIIITPGIVTPARAFLPLQETSSAMPQTPMWVPGTDEYPECKEKNVGPSTFEHSNRHPVFTTPDEDALKEQGQMLAISISKQMALATPQVVQKRAQETLRKLVGELQKAKIKSEQEAIVKGLHMWNYWIEVNAAAMECAKFGGSIAFNEHFNQKFNAWIKASDDFLECFKDMEGISKKEKKYRAEWYRNAHPLWRRHKKLMASSFLYLFPNNAASTFLGDDRAILENLKPSNKEFDKNAVQAIENAKSMSKSGWNELFLHQLSVAQFAYEQWRLEQARKAMAQGAPN